MNLKKSMKEGDRCDGAEEDLRRPSKLVVFLALAVVLTAVTNGAVSQSAHAATLAYGASAYGTSAFVGSSVVLGKTAPVSLGCGSSAGASQSASVLAVSGAPLATTGVISTKVSTTTSSSKASAAVGSVKLLNGLITATAIQAVSTTSQDQSGLHVSGASSIFADLVVAGVPQSSTVPANTTIPLAGLGTVVLNQQIATGGTSTARLTVNMIHVYITVANNLLGIAAGTQLIVASADSSLTVVDGPGLFYGFSYGTSVSGSLVQSSATAPIYLPCLGTNGKTLTNTLASVNVPEVLNSGTLTDTATGNITPSLISGRTTATVQSLNLLNGLVTVETLTVAANASSSDGVHVTLNDTGTSFVNLVVQGHTVTSVLPNTTVALAGGGTLYVRRQIVGANFIDERGLELVIPTSNTLGLPAMDIIVGRAYVKIIKP